MSKRNHCMIDFETAATTTDTVVLTLGAVKFDPYADDRVKEDRENEKMYLKFNIEQQQDHGRVINDETLDWWGRQAPEAFEEAFGDDESRIELEQGLREFTRFFRGCKYIWGHGSVFDVMILEHAYIQYDLGKPWQFWNARDTRTMFDLGFDHEMPMDGHHHALADAMRQVIGVQNVYRKLGLKK